MFKTGTGTVTLQEYLHQRRVHYFQFQITAPCLVSFKGISCGSHGRLQNK